VLYFLSEPDGLSDVLLVFFWRWR